MNKNIFETILGVIVIIVAMVFGFKLYEQFNINNQSKSYIVYALFNNSGGIKKGADVRISGVRIGKILDVNLDNENYKAKIKMEISDKISLSKDSVVEIASDGFIGGKYVRIISGTDTKLIEQNSELENTKDIVSLEQMLGKLIFLTTD
ncbi:MAG: MlaD family protein [Alphaproteobacteria bacterium]